MKLFKKTPKETAKKGFINTIKQEISNMSRAEKFWYGLLYSIFFVLLAFFPEVAGILSCIGSVMLLATLCDGNDEDLYWAPLTFLFWLAIIIVNIGLGIYWVYSKTIEPFNQWLNDPHQKKWNEFNAAISNPKLTQYHELDKRFSIEYNNSPLYLKGRETFFKSNPHYWYNLLKQYQSK